MSDEFRIIFVDGASGAGSGGSSSGGSGVASATSGSAVSLGAKLGAGIALGQELVGMVGDVVNNVLKPVKSIVTAILKMVGEFLRPIADMVSIALMPMLQMLRPLVQIFKAFMAPAMAAAREFAQISQVQMNAGDRGGAMQSALAGVMALIGPFVVSITSIALQLLVSAMTAGIANIIGLLIDAMAMVASAIFPYFKDNIMTSAAQAKEFVNSGMAELENTVNGKILTATESLLGVLDTMTQEKLTTYRAAVEPLMNHVYNEYPLGLLNEMDSKMQTKIPVITGGFATGLNTMSSATGSFASTMETYADRIKKALQRAEEKERSARSLWDTIKDVASKPLQYGPNGVVRSM